MIVKLFNIYTNGTTVYRGIICIYVLNTVYTSYTTSNSYGKGNKY